VLTTLKQIFTSCIENNIIIKNPCMGRRAGGVQGKPKEPLTIAQQQTLIDAVRETRAELFVLLCLYAGLRREEALGLLWDNVYIDVQTPYINVRHTTTLESNGKATHSPNLKSNAAYRTIPIPPQLTEALRRNQEVKDSRFVVPSETTGAEMTLSAFRRMWDIVAGRTRELKSKDEQGKKIIKHYPGLVDFHVTPHLLRHTYITQLCGTGMDIKKIQYLAGHEDVTMTLNIYTKVTRNQPGELAPDIISAFSGTLAGTLRAKQEE
jgi:integrase